MLSYGTKVFHSNKTKAHILEKPYPMNYNEQNSHYKSPKYKTKKYSDIFIREFAHLLTPMFIIYSHDISEDILELFINSAVWIPWDNISIYRNLSESFIRRYTNLVSWMMLPRHQILSESFIREFSNRLYWTDILRYQNVTKLFVKEVFNDVWCDSYVKLIDNKPFNNRLEYIYRG